MIPYLFISGFLGAGKTTLLNNLLRRYSHLKIGVIVNDFGELAVDNMLIKKEHVAGEILELRAGQIFCSCLSGKFVESVLAYEAIQPDLLLVECSGLAKPASLADIVQVIDEKSPGIFNYAGMIALVDATRHAVLEESLMVVNEQIEASDMLLISKASELNIEELAELETHLAGKYPTKSILRVGKESIDQDLVAMLTAGKTSFAAADTARNAAKYEGWGEQGRPTTFTLTLPPTPLVEIMDKLRPFKQRWYRLKGTMKTSDAGIRYIDGVTGKFDALESDGADEYGLVVITHDSRLEHELKAAFGIQVARQMQPLNLMI